MKIGMIAPVTHPYPPPGYGPWERVTHDLTEQLVRSGHEVTLFAPSDSITKARLWETIDHPLEGLPAEGMRREEDDHVRTAIEAASGGDFDLVHSHLHVHVLRLADHLKCPLVTTLHGAAWDRSHHATLRKYAAYPFVSLSQKEREFLPELNYVATIPNGIDMDAFPPGPGDGGYLTFVGRMAPEKAPHLAVEVAMRTGRRLLMAGVIESQHAEYASQVLAAPEVEFLGPLDRPDLSLLLGKADALLMPLSWDEPFGLVVVESLATGTPVVAWRRGAMPEIVDEGVTGYLVDDVETAVPAVAAACELSRLVCAQRAREQFSDSAMAERYAGVYQSLIQPRA